MHEYHGKHEYPKHLYRCVKHGGHVELESCLVNSSDEHERLPSDWAESPELAKAAMEGLEEAVSTAAAERAAADLKLSKKAQAEMDAKEKKTGKHVPE